MSAAQDLLNDQQAFIESLQSDASTAIDNARGINQYAYYPEELGAITPPYPFTPGEPPEPPNFQLIPDVELGTMPIMGELVGISETFAGGAPTFDATKPTLIFGNQPNQLPEFNEELPGITTDFDFPPVPAGASQVFSAPVLSTITAPEAPQVNTPSFDALMPVNEAVAPTDLEVSFKANFNEMDTTLHAVAESHMDGFLAKINPQYHTQMARIETQLETYLAGGTGLDEAVEDAIYARAQAKNDLEAQRVQNAAFADTAARGFTLPSGAMTAALARARQDAANNNAKAANEIAIAQAEMEQKNLQFAVTTSADLRKAAVQSMLQFFQTSISMSGMALDYAKNIMAALIQVYDTQVKVFTVKLEAYKTEATVYDIKARVAMQVIEIYKAQIQAMEALTNVDRAKVEMYKAQIGTLRDYAEIYKAQVEAVVSEASLEKLKIDLFQGQVQAYAAQVQAKTAEWQGYQAKISGEEAKVKIFAAQAAAFNGEVGAFKAQHEAASEKIKAEATRNNAVIQELTAKVSAYEAEIRAKTAVASGNIENLRQHYAAYKGQVDHALAVEQMKLEGYKANVEAVIGSAKINSDNNVANARASGATMAALAAVHGKILEVYSGPASAAAAGMNSLASIQYTE